LSCTGLFTGADGGTLSSAGVLPEVVMKLYRSARAGNWDEARRIQFELLDLFSLMVAIPNLRIYESDWSIDDGGVIGRRCRRTLSGPEVAGEQRA
jgi:dihydrodipicolinate synthase/N-acetylneuraminate lyase